MKLENILEKIEYVSVKGPKDVDIVEITRDSREIKEGYLFIPIVGENIDGHDYIDIALANGAVTVVHSRELKEYREDICYIQVEDTRQSMAEISKVFFHVDKEIKIIGVTGTNGKTTSTYMLKKLIETTGKKVGLIGTIANYIGDRLITTERTTPDSIELFRLIRDMKVEGCEYCIMEVSSHASALNRILGLEFECGGFTNLTQDHLDFHKTFEDYFAAKYKFVKSCANQVVNVDDEYGQRMISNLQELNKSVITYGLGAENADVQAKNIILGSTASVFELYINDEYVTKVNIKIPGLYNISNALCVIGILHKCGIMSVEDMVKGFEQMLSVDGRCERVYHKNLQSTVIVDYAHTPDGLENILKSMKEVSKGKLITVFGCGGNRDSMKRPMMGAIASKYSDYVIVTSDNPRYEKPGDIINDIEMGMSGDYATIEDRKEAIIAAVKMSKKDDIVVIAGKGHETYQIINDAKYHFSDKKTVLEYCDTIND